MDKLWWLSLRNTVLFAALTVGGNVLLGLFASVLVKQQPPGHQILRFLFYTPVVLSVAVMVILARAFNGVRLLNYYVMVVGCPPRSGWAAEVGFPSCPCQRLVSLAFLWCPSGLFEHPEPITGGGSMA